MGDPLTVQTRGEVLDGAREYVRRRLGTFVRRIPERLLSARVRLTAFTRPSSPVPALAQANLDLPGQPVRAQVAARFFAEAAELLRARLSEQVTQLGAPQRARPWPQGVRPVQAAEVPVGRREIARRKAYPLASATPDAAALVMDSMDYDIHLFVDADTGEDSVIYRVGPTGYRLARLVSMAPPAVRTTIPLTINVHPVPTETSSEAVRALDRIELPYRFFRDRDTGRGAVLYRRYDGHYGQISPA